MDTLLLTTYPKYWNFVRASWSGGDGRTALLRNERSPRGSIRSLRHGGDGKFGESERTEWAELKKCLREAARDARGVIREVPGCPRMEMRRAEGEEFAADQQARRADIQAEEDPDWRRASRQAFRRATRQFVKTIKRGREVYWGSVADAIEAQMRLNRKGHAYYVLKLLGARGAPRPQQGATLTVETAGQHSQ